MSRKRQIKGVLLKNFTYITRPINTLTKQFIKGHDDSSSDSNYEVITTFKRKPKKPADKSPKKRPKFERDAKRDEKLQQDAESGAKAAQ